jgi:hypothetical protein
VTPPTTPPDEVWGLEGTVGRHRRVPVATVHLVLRDGSEHVLPADAPLSRSIGAVAAMLAASG